MEHTKGPWYTLPDRENGDTFFIRSESPQRCIAKLGFFAMVKGEVEANARLIATCPTMAQYVISKAKDGDKDAEEIARSFGWTPAG